MLLIICLPLSFTLIGRRSVWVQEVTLNPLKGLLELILFVFKVIHLEVVVVRHLKPGMI